MTVRRSAKAATGPGAAYLAARRRAGMPPVARAGETFRASRGRLGCDPRPLLEAAMFDPDPAFQRFAAWCELEGSRRLIFGDGSGRRDVGGLVTSGSLVRVDPRRLRSSPDDAALERERALVALVAIAAPLGFRVDAQATVDAATGLALENTTKGTDR